jgi:hypothetical protein
LDIKNAFNSAPWEKILDAMREKDIPAYLCRIIGSYLSDRTITFDINGNSSTIALSSGVPQGSVIGPTLWNILYDGLLKVRFPASVTPIAFADDIALICKASDNYRIENDLSEAAKRAHTWLSEVGLQLAAHKSEIMVITRRRKNNDVNITIDGTPVTSKGSLRYLGIQIDSKLNFTEHAKLTAAKASGAAKNLGRFMPNVSAATPSRRRLLGNVVHSLLLFGAPIWADRMSVKGRTEMAKVQRKTALRVTSAYRTVSKEAALVVASMPPIDMLASERQYMFNNKHDAQAKITAIQKTLQAWQANWDAATTKGRWTHRLIPNLEPWLSRKHGETSFLITQALTGHGCFPAYLHRFGKLDSPACWFCGHIPDDANHTLFECDAWASRRSRVNILLGSTISHENLILLMIKSQESWAIISNFIIEVMKKKENEERRRQSAPTN